MSKVINLAHQLAEIARQEYARKAARNEYLLNERLKRSGQYVGFDSETGVHKVRLLDGSIRVARSITNGGLQKGDPVSFTQPLGAQVGMIKAMPR